MLVLTGARKLQVLLGEAIATEQLEVNASWGDYKSPAFTPGGTDLATNGVTPVDVVPAPAADTARMVKDLTVYNADTIGHVVILQVVGGSGTRRRYADYIPPGGSLIVGESKSVNAPASVSDKFMLPMGFLAANLTAALTTVSNASYFQYMGRTARRFTQATLRYRISTAAVTVTWAEVAIFVGTPVLGGNPSLTRRGFTNVASVVTSLGQKSTVIAATVEAGEDVWAVYGGQSTTVMQLRAGLADDLQTGVYCSQATTRPSTCAIPFTPTLAGATGVLAWLALDF
jgi:hypothetical protein